jgi:hypothetical protein
MRGERFEVVDGDGAVRAVLGPLDGGGIGLALFGADGVERLRLAVDDESTALTLTVDGNIVFAAGWLAPGGDVVRPGGYAVVADADGTPTAGWRVHDDGTITGPGAAGP